MIRILASRHGAFDFISKPPRLLGVESELGVHDVLVAGSYVFSSKDPIDTIASLKKI